MQKSDNIIKFERINGAFTLLKTHENTCFSRFVASVVPLIHESSDATKIGRMSDAKNAKKFEKHAFLKEEMHRLYAKI